MKTMILTSAALSMALAAPGMAANGAKDMLATDAASVDFASSGSEYRFSQPEKGDKGKSGKGDDGNRGNQDKRDKGAKELKALDKDFGEARKALRKDIKEARKDVRDFGNKQADNERTYREERRDDRTAEYDGKKYDKNRRAQDDRNSRLERDMFYVGNDGRFGFDIDRDVRRSRDYYAVRDCPPGLAKKNNGCLPPGQAKKLYNDRQDSYLGYSPRYQGDNFYQSNGYAYQLDTGSPLVNAFLPLIGGALFEGNRWPASYASNTIPQYYQNYYGNTGSDYDYRYADRTIFRVDPQSQAITGLAALLTGNDFTVGQRAPSGYDVYNVPYDYRSRYADGPDANYRYSDGYVYKIDPKTRLVAAAIELLG